MVASHGTGGNALVHSDMARALVDAGFVVAVPRHRGDNAFDHSEPGPESWKKRPGEVSRAIDAVARHPALQPLLSFERVGMFGMSAGGHTALTFAGGRWSPSAFYRHCEAHIAEDFPFCVGLITRLDGGLLDPVKKKAAVFAIRRMFDGQPWYGHEDPRVQAVIAAVPAAAVFDFASLAQPRVPLGLVTTGQDKWLNPRLHAQPLLQACAPRCGVVAHLAHGDHGSILSPPPPRERLGELAAELLSDPPGFDRRELREVHARIAAFFRQHLLP